MSQSRSPVPLMGAAVYLLGFVGAVIYTLFTRETFSGLACGSAEYWMRKLQITHAQFDQIAAQLELLKFTLESLGTR